ncbi:hypothetical protein MFIFM68171_02153 [Madurella fahalii]|uniref:Uncharacterized protein n=1 Tax=Madurella fahalii TaxID=1157608 RepID=A0ABQ0G2F7_9PEZI
MAASDEQLWKIFANKLKSTFTVGQDIGPKNRVYIPLLNATAIPAGNSVDSAITNYGVAQAGDSLINLDNPMLVRSNESYAKRCLSYLRYVQLNTDSSVGSAEVLKERRATAEEADKRFHELKRELRQEWEENGKVGSFDTWARETSNSYSTYKTEADSAAAALRSVMAKVMGPGGEDLTEMLRNLGKALAQEPSNCTMAVSSAQVTGNPVVSRDWAPKYVIDAGYTRAVQNWISTSLDPGVKETKISFNPSESSQYSWESLGHSSDKVKARGGFFPFFRVEYTYEKEKKTHEIRASDIGSTVNFELVARGIRAFTIDPDSSWNPGDVQAKYPNVFPETPAFLKEPMVQITHVVVGFKVDLKIKMDKALYDKVSSYMEEASKHDANATATIFGFRINVGGSGSHETENSTNWSDVKKNQDGREIVIPASTDNNPVLLAAFGKVLGN